MRGQGLFAATALAAALICTPQAGAQQYRSYHDEHVSRQQQCERERNNNTVAGVVLGGLAGAVLGSNVAERGHRGDGAALGAVLGAAAGGAIGRTNARCNQIAQGDADPYAEPYDPYYPNSQAPYDDGSGLEGGPYQESSYGYGDDDYGRDCRMGQMITSDRYGRERRESVLMCRGNDGVYRPRD